MKTDPVYKFIQAMSRDEKVYFKKSHFKTNDSKQFIELFDIYQKLETYDKTILNKHILKTRFSKQISRVRSYLFEKLLASQVKFHALTDYELKIDAEYHKGHVLFKMKLYDESLKIISKQLEFIQNHDLMYFESRFLRLKNEILKEKLSGEINPEVLKREITIAEKIQEFTTFQLQSYSFIKFLREFNVKDEKELQKELEKRKIKNLPSTPKSTQTQLAINHYHFAYNHYKRNPKQAKEYLLNSLKLYEQKGLDKLNSNGYLDIIHNVDVMHTAGAELKETIEWNQFYGARIDALQKATKLKLNRHRSAYIFNGLNHELNFEIKAENSLFLSPLSEHVLNHEQKNSGHYSYTLLIYFSFQNRQTKKVIYWLDLLNKNKHISPPDSIKSILIIIELISRLDEGQNIENLLPKLKRRLINLDLFSEFEKCIFDYLTELTPFKNSESEFVNISQDLLNEIELNRSKSEWRFKLRAYNISKFIKKYWAQLD